MRPTRALFPLLPAPGPAAGGILVPLFAVMSFVGVR
jgi:hypothetical protein